MSTATRTMMTLLMTMSNEDVSASCVMAQIITSDGNRHAKVRWRVCRQAGKMSSCKAVNKLGLPGSGAGVVRCFVWH